MKIDFHTLTAQKFIEKKKRLKKLLAVRCLQKFLIAGSKHSVVNRIEPSANWQTPVNFTYDVIAVTRHEFGRYNKNDPILIKRKLKHIRL